MMGGEGVSQRQCPDPPPRFHWMPVGDFLQPRPISVNRGDGQNGAREARGRGAFRVRMPSPSGRTFREREGLLRGICVARSPGLHLRK